jgi:hypothetical protein
MAQPISGFAVSPAAASKSLAIHVEQPGRVAIGYLVAESDGGQPVSVSATQGGSALSVDYNATVNNGYDNNDSATLIQQWATFEAEAGEVQASIDCSAGSATIRGITVEVSDIRGGVAQTYAAGAHSSPKACRFGGELLTVRVEPGSCEPYLFADGRRVCNLGEGVPASAKQTHDTYHTTWSLLPCAGGIAAIVGWHNGTHYLRWAATADGLATATPRAITASGATYIRAACLDEDSTTIYVLARLASPSQFPALLTITGFNGSGAPTVVEDYLQLARGYPRWLSVEEVDGTTLVCAAWQYRNGELWQDCFAAIYVPSTGRWHGVAGSGPIGKATRGNVNDARFAHPSAGNYPTAPTLLDLKPGGQRYVPAAIMRITGWGASASAQHADALCVFCDTTNTGTDGDAVGLDVRLCFLDGSEGDRITTAAADNVLGLDNTDTFRLATALRWVDRFAGTFDLVIGGVDGGDNENRIEEQSRDDYYEFGAVGPGSRWSGDLSSVTDSASFAAGLAASDDVVVEGPVRWWSHGFVHGGSAELLVERCVGELHQTGQVGRYQLIGGDAPAVVSQGHLPAAADVRDGVDRGDGIDGTITLPAAEDVEAGVEYGAGGDELTGSFAGGSVVAELDADAGGANSLAVTVDSEPAAGFAVELYDRTDYLAGSTSSDDALLRTTTAADGTWPTLRPDVPGDYALTFRKFGFKDAADDDARAEFRVVIDAAGDTTITEGLA